MPSSVPPASGPGSGMLPVPGSSPGTWAGPLSGTCEGSSGPPGCPGCCGSPAGARKPKRSAGKKTGAAAGGDSVTSPMQGTIVKVSVDEGQEVAEGDVIVVLEAMKMEQPLKAHKAGTVTGLQAEVGATVTNGAVICELKD